MSHYYYKEKMSFLRRLGSSIASAVTTATTLTGALYNAGVATYQRIVGRPAQPVPPPAPELTIQQSQRELLSNVKVNSIFTEVNFELYEPEQLMDVAEALISPADEKFKGHFKITYQYQGRTLNESTKYVYGIQNSLNNLKTLVRDLLAKYDGVLILEVRYEYLEAELAQILAQGSRYTEQCICLPEVGCTLRYDDDYVIYNPHSKTNCFFQSVAVCLKPTLIGEREMTNKGGEKLYKYDPIVEKAKQLKKNSKCTNSVTTAEDMLRTAQYCKININLVNEKNELVENFYGGDKMTIQIIYFKNHCYPMIRYQEECNYRNRYNVSNVVSATKPEKNRDLLFYAGDLEAVTDQDGLSIAYSIAYAYYNKNETIYREFIGHEDCLSRFFDSLFEDKKNKTIYFHNGGKYDVNVIIQNFLLNNEEYSIDNKAKVYLNGRYARFVVYKDKTKVTFLDSICLFNMSLEKCTGKKGFDVDHKKLTGAIDHRKVTLENYREIMEKGMGGHTGSEYLKNDVIGLLECLDKFGNDIWEEYGINITKVISASSISKRIFKQNFIDPKRPIYLLDETEDGFIRQSYHGGRTEAFFKGVYSTEELKIEGVNCRQGKVYYYDFTSLYPSVACVGNCDMPYGRCHPINKNGLFKAGELIGEKHLEFMREKAMFLKVEVKTIDFNRRPIHCLQADKTGRLVFPYFKDWTEIYLTSEEILTGLTEKIYQYKIVDGYWFNKAPILKDYFASLGDKKQEATKAGLESKALCLKIIANSGYGFWALRTEARPDVDIIDAKDSDALFARILNDFDDIYRSGDKIVISFKKNIEGAEKNIALGSYITSLARLKLWSLIDAIERKGEKVLYCDTDSVLTTLRVEDHADLMERFMWDGCGKELGALKNEIKDAIGKDCKKRGIVPPDYDHIDLVYFAGLKSYRYVSNYGDGLSIDDSKLKGYKQHGEFVDPEDNVRVLEDTDYINLLSGNELKQRVSQFSSNKRGKYQEWQKITSIEKRFNFSYNKGKVQGNGFIIPFTLPQDVALMIQDEEKN